MKLSRKTLAGMRQRYPDAMRKENYVLDGIRRAGLSYGFEEYDAPLLEPLELFLAKSGTELAREQSYNFIDKGDREIILRPELTPSLARMVAAGGELLWPLRWMSFPLCYRYERPQRGRAREFLQFNCDVLGSEEPQAELDVFLVLNRIMSNFSTDLSTYRIAWSSRQLVSSCLERSGLDPGELTRAFAVIDKKVKMEPPAWSDFLSGSFDDLSKVSAIRRFTELEDLEDPWLVSLVGEEEFYSDLCKFQRMLSDAGLDAAVFDPVIVRGLDYYTGIVFELTDTGSQNRRALCGGGRYDDLVGLFGGKRVSGVGFGLGILTLTLFLETYDLIPAEVGPLREVQLFMTVYSPVERGAALSSAETLRDNGITVEMYLGKKDLSKQFRLASRLGIPWVAVIGPDEVETSTINLKNMETGQRYNISLEDVPAILSVRDSTRLC
jgi:histidyl-tRNA synthetase